jgi:hypothetical protein
MIQDGLAKDSGEPIQLPGTIWGWNSTGYVAVVDVAGDAAYFMLLEPFRDERSYPPDAPYSGSEIIVPKSVVDHGGTAEYYKVAFRQEILANPDVGQGPGAAGEPLDARLRQYFLSDRWSAKIGPH